MALTKTHNRMIDEALIIVTDYGAVGDGSTDDTVAFQNALADGKSQNKTVTVPYGVYVIKAPLDCHLVSFVGDNKGDWPVLKCDPAFSGTGMLRVGQATAGSSLTDRGIVENFTLNMDNAPQNTKGVYCEYGVNYKTIRNINASTALLSTAATITKNLVGFDLRISSSATQGLYYLQIDNLIAASFFRGFYTSGDANDGLRVSNIGGIRCNSCVQSMTFKDAELNTIGTLAVNFHRNDLDTSGATPSQWDIYMTDKKNVIENVFLHSDTGSLNSRPLIFCTANHQFLNVTPLTTEHDTDGNNVVQIINEAGVRQSGTKKETGYNVLFDNQIQTGSISGPQTQKNLMVNGDFYIFTGGSASIADATDFAYAWTSVKEEATATLGITSATGPSLTSIYNRSCLIAVASPVVNKLYGFKQDIADQLALSGGLLNTLYNNFEALTLGVRCRPAVGNSASMRVRIEVDDGISTSNENYLISYNQSTDNATNDQLVFGGNGDWWNLIHQIQLSDAATKLEIKFGYYPSTTTNASIYVDGVYLIAGAHTQYGVRPYIETPSIIRPAAVQANTNTPSGATAQAIPLALIDGSVVWVPAYTSQW
jgi:hypothetical protein